MKNSMFIKIVIEWFRYSNHFSVIAATIDENRFLIPKVIQYRNHYCYGLTLVALRKYMAYVTVSKRMNISTNLEYGVVFQ